MEENTVLEELKPMTLEELSNGKGSDILEMAGHKFDNIKKEDKGE